MCPTLHPIFSPHHTGRIPLSHVDALARDIRETGVAFKEGEILKIYHAEALAWDARAAEAVAARARKVTVAELNNLLMDADVSPLTQKHRARGRAHDHENRPFPPFP